MEIIIVILVGLVSGFLGATVGGGGMISIPALLFLGLPPHVVVGTNKVGDIGAFAAAVKEYLKAKRIDLRMALVLACLAVVGSILGTQIMIQLDAHSLRILIGVVILVFLPFLLLKRNMGLKKREIPRWKVTAGMVIFFLLSVIGAVTGGAGGATVALFLMIYFFGFEIIRGYATNTPSELIQAVIPATIYFLYGFVHIPFATVLLISSFAGGFIGSKTALKGGSKWVRNLFVIVVILSVIKILFF